MQHGFIKVAAGTPNIQVADVNFNVSKIIEIMNDANSKEIKLLVLPELCITGYTCNDLFLQKKLLDGAEVGIEAIIKASKELDMITIVGAPIRLDGNLYNCAVVIYKGDILGVVPKFSIPNYSEFYEKRYFTPSPKGNGEIKINNKNYPFGTKQLFMCSDMPEFCFAVEICEDLWAPENPSTEHVLAGALIIANLSASNEVVGKAKHRRELIEVMSSKMICGYIYADAGEGESTTDLVFAGHNIITENGVTLNESNYFNNNLILTEIDVDKLAGERRKRSSFQSLEKDKYNKIYFEMKENQTILSREFSENPFIPDDESERKDICKEILIIQALGLKKRVLHSACKNLVIGISGGLDSTLALMVSVKVMDLLSLPHSNIVAVTMPCFGTSERTLNNARMLSNNLGVTLKEIDITDTVLSHFKDIEQDEGIYDVAFENAQARERTQVLMDIANKMNGMVIGTGDLSELALGWATYNGDHMSMYAVNSSVPKTLIRHIISYFIEESENTQLRNVLSDILDTPVSPELLPSKYIEQRTEDIVGPYELHDFFMYYILRWNFEPKKVFRLAVYVFNGMYGKEIILKWLKVFYRRFFSQQFKRSCMPDGPKVGTVALSPRGDLRMPSDACVNLWMKDLEDINVL